MRTYHFVMSRPGQDMEARAGTSRLRIRAVAVVMFRKWFGREPNSSWGKDGYLAEACDVRGNRINVTQTNHSLCEQWHTLDPRLFRLFAWDGRKFQPYIPPSHQLAWKEAA